MMAEEYRLPCDVHLPPATIIKAGCPISTLQMAMEIPGRPRHFTGRPIAVSDPQLIDLLRGQNTVADSDGDDGA